MSEENAWFSTTGRGTTDGPAALDPATLAGRVERVEAAAFVDQVRAAPRGLGFDHETTACGTAARPNPSLRNMLRAGFVPVHDRDNDLPATEGP